MTSSTMPTLAVRSRVRPWLAAAALAGTLLAISGCGSSSKSPTTKAATATPQRASTTQTTSTINSVPAVTVSSTTSSSHTVSASSGGITAKLSAGTHQPKVEAPWPIQFTVTRGGRPVTASVSYEYLFGGQVVAHRSHYTFKGHFSDVFKWPPSAVGYPLTFRAVVTSGRVKINLDYPVQVSR
ncbi:MAG TPA: hypothetical protein VK778_11840 [Solirubrobacteraceae bacterium]|jgi:hypothetical protein|nr:hypothetical protein [Solirubrobacteraceae bacterium]